MSRILHTSYIRGNKVVVIEVSPVSYNPQKNQIEYYQTIEINLKLKPSDKKLISGPVKNKKKFDHYLKVLVDNKEDVEKYSTITEIESRTHKTSLKNGTATTGIPIYCEYVVITSSYLSSYFDDFIEWKKQKGIDIELVTTEQIIQNYTGDEISGIIDNPGKIRQFLKDACENGLEYALLGGDSIHVPIRNGTGFRNYWTLEELHDYKIPTDLYFSDFDGDWDYDNDQFYGEEPDGLWGGITEGDNLDYGAEIFVGRLLCNNGTHIQNWTNKLLLYEQNPGNGSTSYLRKAFYTQADQLQQNNQAADIASRFGSIFTTNTIFNEEYNGVPNYNSPESPQFPTGAEVISEMNSGYGFVSWFNHGNPNNIAVATKGVNGCINNDRKKITYIDSYNGCKYYYSSVPFWSSRGLFKSVRL